MEELVVGALNVFDLFVRFVPGSIAVAYFLFPCDPEIATNMPDSVKLTAFLALSYAAGILLRPIANFLRRVVSDICFGGRMREVYASDDAAMYPVIANEGTRMLARRCIDLTYKMCGVGENDSDFAFGFMVSYLESAGRSGKSDRLQSLADTCMSLAAASVVCAVLTPLARGGKLFEGGTSSGVAIVLLLACGGLFVYAGVRYQRMRFATVVRTFLVCRDSGTCFVPGD